MNKNWSRWIIASVADYFMKTIPTIPVYMEGEVTDRRSNKPAWCELRLNGPHFREITRGHWELRFSINILISAVKNPKDMYAIYRVVGTIEPLFVTIPVYKYGDEPDDNKDEKLGCLNLDSTPVKTNHYGQVTTDKPILQSTVEGQYTMELYTDPY